MAKPLSAEAIARRDADKAIIQSRKAREAHWKKNLWEVEQVSGVHPYYGGIRQDVEYFSAPTKEEAFKAALNEFLALRMESGRPTKKPFIIEVAKRKLNKEVFPIGYAEVYQIELKITKLPKQPKKK